MKSNELRIGNIVFDEHDFPLYVSAIYPAKDGTGYLIEDSSENVIPIENTKPIPLTTEILERSGFINCSEAMFQSKIGTLFLKRPFVEANHFLVKTTSLDKITSIRSLHELQNFFYSITGEEMTVVL